MLSTNLPKNIMFTFLFRSFHWFFTACRIKPKLLGVVLQNLDNLSSLTACYSTWVGQFSPLGLFLFRYFLPPSLLKELLLNLETLVLISLLWTIISVHLPYQVSVIIMTATCAKCLTYSTCCPKGNLAPLSHIGENKLKRLKLFQRPCTRI